MGGRRREMGKRHGEVVCANLIVREKGGKRECEPALCVCVRVCVHV